MSTGRVRQDERFLVHAHHDGRNRSGARCTAPPNAQHDIPRLLDLYNKGQLKLDELIAREYALEDDNQGYEDMRNGLNIRGLIRY